MEPEIKTAALLGGQEVTAALIDGSTETVKVRQLPIRQLQKFMALMGDEAAMVELVCDKPNGWADSLSIDSFEAIAALAWKINHPTFERQVLRLQEKGLAVQPLVKKIEAMNSPAFSQAQP